MMTNQVFFHSQNSYGHAKSTSSLSTVAANGSDDDHIGTK